MATLSYRHFLESKPLFYRKIDYTRMPRAYRLVEPHLKLNPIIHIIGTNGKGTTGRFLALGLLELGRRVGHYTSPHLRDIRERIWVNGAPVSEEQLELAHRKLQNWLPQNLLGELSYFEYTTLLMAVIFQQVEYPIVEAGLGGEFDATAVFPQQVTLLTPVDRDHESFLGEKIEEIATTKLRSVRREVIVGEQPHWEIVKRVLKRLGLKYYSYREFFTPQQRKEFRERFYFPEFLFSNLLLSLSYFKWRGLPIPETPFWEKLDLPGRLQQIGEQVWIDVGHNRLAAKGVRTFFQLRGKKVYLLYNSYADKNFREILEVLRPILKGVAILPVERNPRIADPAQLKEIVQRLEIPLYPVKEVLNRRPLLIFGSFSVVERFLRDYWEEGERGA
ncbi:MAG: bifunctional folylpolyglutamate synthase/dihydrofolate synthase [Campylobacterales bacterium]